MRVYNPQCTDSLLPELRCLLERLRRRRGFDVERYIQAKAIVLCDYMHDARLNACVIAVSGGIDSAVVLGLASLAKSLPDSPVERILAVMLPIFDPGATHQREATERGKEVSLAFGIEPTVIDLSSSHAALKGAVDGGLNLTGEPWASGQLVSYARTPALYYMTSLLTQQGHAGILLGTTNCDEGGYLGFIGKASDAMVDIQVISDLHKSEVTAVARTLGVPVSVVDAIPTGDMYDGRPDETVFGAPYDFVEFYLLYKDLADDSEREAIRQAWSAEAQGQFSFFANNLEELHRYNAHKYLGKSPAVHLDVLKSSTPGGWNNSLYLGIVDPPVDASRIAGQFELGVRWAAVVKNAPDPEIIRESLLDLGDSALILRGVFSELEMAALREDITDCAWTPVGVNGMKTDFHPENDAVGSWRATAYSPAFAQALWDRISGCIGSPRIMEALTPTDWDGTHVWQAVGVNPLLRFIRYTQEGRLIPHYDAPFVTHGGKRTLVSLLLYIDVGEGHGGATRLIRDPQANIPVEQRKLEDWSRFPSEEEILFRVRPEQGTCLALDHRILHDSEPYSGAGQKLILRTDIFFERCGTVSAHA